MTAKAALLIKHTSNLSKIRSGPHDRQESSALKDDPLHEGERKGNPPT
jgi:hypothetical protein